MPPLEQKPGSPNIDSLDPNKVEKLGRDKPVTGNDLQAGETAAGLLRADLPTNQVPGSNTELKDRIAGFRTDVASSEGVGLARRAELQINGEKVRGIETTNAEGVTNFYARGGKEAWTVNTDGTYTPIKPSTGEPIAGAPVVRAEKAPAGAATSDGAAVTTPDSSVAAFAQGLDSRVMKGLVQQPQFQAFAAQHDLTGVQSTRRGDTTVYTTKDGASFSFDRSDKKLSFQAGADQPAASLTWKQGSGVQYEAPAAPAGTTPVVKADTPVVKADTPVVKADTPAVTPVVVPKPGETQVYPSGNQFTRTILDATGATKYDPKTGNLTFADGHTQGVTAVLDQLKASGQIQGGYNFNNRDDVRNLVQDLRTVNPTTFRPDGGLPGGIKPVDVGVKPVDVSGKPVILDGAGKPIDTGKLVDATGRQIDLGRLTQQDLAKFNPDFAKMTQQDFRNLSQQDIAKMMMQDRMGGGDQMQALRMQQLQMDLQNPQLRAQMLDAMSKIQAGKLDALGPNGQRMADILKDLGLDKSGISLKQLLDNPQGLGKLDALQQQKLANFMDLMQGRTTADGGVPRSPFERLTDFLKVNQQALDKGLTGEGGKAFFLELNKILKDLNTQLGLKPGEGLTVADIMGRRMQDGRLAAELGLLPGQLSLKDVRGDMFAVKLNAGETMNVRMMQLQQELMGKNMTPALRDVLNQILNPSALQQTTLRTSELGMAAQLTGRPIDVLIQGVRQLDQGAIKDAAASTLLSQITRDMGLKDAGTAGILGGKEFNAALKLDPTAIKVDGAAKAQADMAAALGQLGMRVDPSLAGIKDVGLNPLNPLDMATAKEQSAAAMKALEEEQAKQKKKKEEEEEEARLDKEEQQAKDAALAALIAAKKRQELKEKEEQEKAQEKDKKEPERRTKYIVKEGDTLESIASKMLRDKRLAALIYEINKEVIPVIQRKGRDVVALRPKMVIWLPTTQEIREFRGRLVAGGGVKLDFGEASKKLTAEEELTAKFGENWDGEQGGKNAPAATGEDLEDLAADAVAAAKKRRENIEKLLGPLSGAKQEAGSRSTYVVRLGDTLKSVSMKHPLLQDVGLWKLLAEVNDMTARTDEKGVPQAALRRGMTIAIPTAEEVAAYKARTVGGDRKTNVYASGPHDLKTKNCGGCGRATIASASICPGCFRSFDEEVKLAPNTVAQTRPAAAAGALAGGGAATEPVSPPAATSGPETQPMMRDDRTRVVRSGTTSGDGPTTQIAASVDEGPTDTVQISEQVRVSRHGEVELHGLKLRLEMRLTGTYWLPVLGYEIFEDVALRHEYNADGSRRTVRIDLPPQAAKELAENDITSNWRVYCDKFASTAGAPRP